MGVNCVGKLCENPIHFVCIFIVWRFFWPKILEINRALLKLFMHMKTHFSSISTYRDLSLCNFFFSATLIYISGLLKVREPGNRVPSHLAKVAARIIEWLRKSWSGCENYKLAARSGVHPSKVVSAVRASVKVAVGSQPLFDF